MMAVEDYIINNNNNNINNINNVNGGPKNWRSFENEAMICDLLFSAFGCNSTTVDCALLYDTVDLLYEAKYVCPRWTD
jgi:hypothetical protein